MDAVIDLARCAARLRVQWPRLEPAETDKAAVICGTRSTCARRSRSRGPQSGCSAPSLIVRAAMRTGVALQPVLERSRHYRTSTNREART